MAPSVPKASRTRRNIGRGYGPKVNHHGEPGISRKFNDLRHLWPAPKRPYRILARHRTRDLFMKPSWWPVADALDAGAGRSRELDGIRISCPLSDAGISP